MADVHTLRLNGVDFPFQDQVARSTGEANSQAITALTSRVAQKQNEITFSDDFDYDAQTGSLALAAGSTLTVDDELSLTSVNAVQNKVITAALNDKQATIQSTARVSVNENNEIELHPDTSLDTTSSNVVTNATVAGALFEKLSLVYTMPTPPRTGMCVLYMGATTEEFNQCSVYRYSGVAWVELIGTIDNSEIDALFD